ncbi:hypothetical protein IVB22_18550 [Bradyrhizobium sp. 190]|uniref:hypothetical protein n=1 Tax=Bradyrhizobium sp. 190 TaxID=2782658 RepID=UPI001FF789F6|nr:hypothetical protein [Bradyrhizobium sp. 190]MCK1514531.1 hypothetical protein [Bradyrhizobium sp. 190]
MPDMSISFWFQSHFFGPASNTERDLTMPQLDGSDLQQLDTELPMVKADLSSKP